MNLEFFITKRIAFRQGKSFSGFIIKIAIAAVALSMAVMIITTATVNGFQHEVSRKIFGFWGHIHITKYKLNAAHYEDTKPISKHQNFYPNIDSIEGIRHIQVYANKAGIIKTDTDIEGILLKGIGSDFDWSFLTDCMVSGKSFSLNDSTRSNNIVISATTANRLQLAVGDKMAVYFVQRPVRVRQFTISGIYKTALEEYDEKYAIIDIKHIQKLNKWTDDEVGGFEVFLDDVQELDKYSDVLYYHINNHTLLAQTIKEINPNIFEWLALQNMNEYVILLLMVLVAIINMITALLILILERTNMVGIMKALGANNWSIRKIFLYNATFIIGLGLIIGNLLGLGICVLQQQFGIIQLPEESYYINVAPIAINWFSIILLNVGTMLVCVIAMIIPSYLVTHIDPIKAIRFK